MNRVICLNAQATSVLAWCQCEGLVHHVERRRAQGSGLGFACAREFDVGQSQLAFEIDDLAGIGSFQHVSRELKDVSADEHRQRQQKDRDGEQTEVDWHEQDAQDRGRDADHMQDEACGIKVSLQPVLHQGMWG